MTTKTTTKKAAHTPGPWVIAGRAPHDNSIEIKTINPSENKRQFIAAVYPKPHYDDTQEADARLIVAAPDLLEAAKETLAQLNFHRGNVTGILVAMANVEKQLEAAIAKAEREWR